MENQDYQGREELFIIERCLANYNLDIVRKFSIYLKGRDILDFGAGIGTLAAIWSKINSISPDCVEIDSNNHDITTKRGFYCYSAINDIRKKYDGIYSSNVLEHIEDDVGILRRINLLLKPSGLVAIYVPAFQCLYSDLDRSVGHLRRYKKVDLIHKLEQAGFEVIKCQFVDSMGFFASLFLRIFGYKKNQNNFYFYDKYIYPISRFLDMIGAQYWFGKNLLVIAQKINQE